MGSAEQFASGSTTVREAATTTAESESRLIRLDNTTSAGKRGLLDVDHSVPPGVGATVLAATLHLYKAAAFTNAPTLTAAPLDDVWDPETSTWANQPGVRAGTATASVSSGGAEGDEVTLNLTALIESAVATDDASASRWYGVRLSIDTNGEETFHSAYSDPDYRPWLDITWNVPPDAPEDPKPSGGLAVSETTPELIATFVDDDASDTISAIEVEVDNNSDFSSPAYDSGKISHTEARFDLGDPPAGSPAVTPLTAGTTYFWRMRVWDSHDEVSEWSETASFTIVVKGTLTLSAPGATVSTPTPTITHSLASVTQDQVEVEVERKEDGVWVEHYLIPWAVSAATSHVIPDEYALEEGEEYRVTVRVTDDEDRADMAGDRSFYEVSQEFTLTALSEAP